MINKNKKLSIAFYWQMHQPVYRIQPNSDFLMPWVRLHSVKDYLDMILIMEDFKGLKLNFNLVPALIDAIESYAENGAHDIYSRLTVTDIEDLTVDDKTFILNNFFDANYNSMIEQHLPYKKLYEKRLNCEQADVYMFTNQEYSDIMAWFNLVWFDPIYAEMYDELNEFYKKESGFTLSDRVKIIEIQRDIMRKIIPTYRKYLEENRIEITTSPYYHPILPILSDIKCAHRNIANPQALPTSLKMAQDAKNQTLWALDRIEEVFGRRPKGIWPPEHCVSSKTFEMLKELGVQWTITDEGILSNSINFEFVRDFRGYLENPYHLLKTYEYKTQSSNLQVIFRDSSIPDLISFEYYNQEPEAAANDLYERIKVIQSKILTSPDEEHLLTIALDGENCWENYVNDGANFLKTLYELIEKDPSLETVLISEYLDKDKNKKTLPKIYSGSWINRNFQLWIGEPVKNLAWTYLKKVRDDLHDFEEKNPNYPNLEYALRQLYVAQGSDWFWWYGEPNNSGQDHIFDYLFREHLKFIYRILNLAPPNYLDTPLTLAGSLPSRFPACSIKPVMDGQDKIDDEWLNAGCIVIGESPYSNDPKFYDKICFGFDENNFYLRFYIREGALDEDLNHHDVNQILTFMRNCDRKINTSNISLVHRSENVFPILQESFSRGLSLAFSGKEMMPITFARAIQGNMWILEENHQIKIAFDNVVDISIPFDNIGIDYGETLEFFFVTSRHSIVESFTPQNVFLIVQRPRG